MRNYLIVDITSSVDQKLMDSVTENIDFNKYDSSRLDQEDSELDRLLNSNEAAQASNVAVNSNKTAQ